VGATVRAQHKALALRAHTARALAHRAHTAQGTGKLGRGAQGTHTRARTLSVAVSLQAASFTHQNLDGKGLFSVSGWDGADVGEGTAM